MDLTQPQTLRALLETHGVRARKGLGQHFLCSKATVNAIAGCLEGVRGVLEIGPGPGVLTSMLCERCEKVVAIELDERMAAVLTESAPCAEVFQVDALKADLGALLGMLPVPRAVVSNLPYYITGPLLTRAAEFRQFYDRAVFMMQREVADRVLAEAGTPARGSLSVFLQLQFAIRRVCQVPAGSFWPPPKVDSTVLLFRPKPAEYAPELEERLFELVRIGFRQPRKTMENNLSAGYQVPKATAAVWLGSLDGRIRPQQLTNDQWIALAERVEP